MGGCRSGHNRFLSITAQGIDGVSYTFFDGFHLWVRCLDLLVVYLDSSTCSMLWPSRQLLWWELDHSCIGYWLLIPFHFTPYLFRFPLNGLLLLLLLVLALPGISW
jgi:hypothetical protein